MPHEIVSAGTRNEGATVVVTHRVREGRLAEYDQCLNAIGPECRASPGCLDLQVIRPIADVTSTYTVVIRFDLRKHLEIWMNSNERARFVEEVRPLLAKDDEYSVLSGLDFLFTPEGGGARVPIRWKQFLVTWSAVYPLLLGVSLVLSPILRQPGLLENHYIDTLLTTGIVVALTVYIVMPAYTRLIQRWLFA